MMSNDTVHKEMTTGTDGVRSRIIYWRRHKRYVHKVGISMLLG